MAQSQRVTLFATSPNTSIRVAWLPGPAAHPDATANRHTDTDSDTNSTAPETACLCIYSVVTPRDYRKTTSEPLQRRVPATALTGASLQQAARLRVDLATEATSLPSLPGLVRYHVNRAETRASAKGSVSISPDVCAIVDVEPVVLGCCWLGGRDTQRPLLAVASDKADPSGATVDVLAVHMPTSAIEKSVKGAKNTKSIFVTFVGRYAVAPTGSRFTVAVITGCICAEIS